MANSASFQHLGSFSDLVDYVQMVRVSEERYSHENLSQRIGDVLAIGVGAPEAQDLRVHSTWSNRGLRCEEVSWSVGYGPRTFGWVLRPDNNAERLPGVLALHLFCVFRLAAKVAIAERQREPVFCFRPVQPLGVTLQ